LAPIYELVATDLKNESISVAKVDATKERSLTARFPVKGYPALFYIHHQLVYRYEGGRSKEGLVHFAKKGYESAKPLDMLESPFSVMGKAKGAVIRTAGMLAEVYDTLRQHGFQPPTAIAIMGVSSVLGVIFASAFIAWVVAPSPLNHEHVQ
jgi:hypothetical protein